MIAFSNFTFAAPPRCGSTWILSAAAAAGLGELSKSKIHEPWRLKDHTKFRVSVVRHPCDWFESYLNNVFPGAVGVSEVDVFSSLRIPPDFVPDFDKAVSLYLERCPGVISKMFLAYEADTFLSHKNLTNSFIDFLRSLPEEVTEEQIERVLSVAPENVSHPKKKSRMNASQRRAVMEAESVMMNAFNLNF